MAGRSVGTPRCAPGRRWCGTARHGRSRKYPTSYVLLHEDGALVAVIKPRGLPTLAGGGFLAGTLLALVRARYPEARPLHRLGRHTSGIVLFARTHAAAALLAGAWRDHAVEKRYRALGSGVATWNTLAMDAPIGPVAHPRLGTVHAASASGKPAHSVAHVLERRGDATLFDVQITTGRPHQIRIHLAYAGHPLAGDPLYVVGGRPGASRPALPGDGGYLLHAARLRFVHPITNVPTELSAPPPRELRTRDELAAGCPPEGGHYVVGRVARLKAGTTWSGGCPAEGGHYAMTATSRLS